MLLEGGGGSSCRTMAVPTRSAANAQVNELRRRRDAQRGAVKQRQTQLRALDKEIADLRRTATDTASRARPLFASSSRPLSASMSRPHSANTSRSLSAATSRPMSANASASSLRGGPSMPRATEFELAAAHSDAAERAYAALEQQRVLEHMAKRKRKERSAVPQLPAPSSRRPIAHHTTPHHTTPHRTAPHRAAPHRTAPHRTAPHRTAPRHATPRHASPCAPLPSCRSILNSTLALRRCEGTWLKSRGKWLA